MNELLNYGAIILPGMILICLILIFLPKKEIFLRLLVLFLGFILMRDALQPARLWHISPSLEMRFTGNTFSIWLLAISSAVIAYSLRFLLDVPSPTIWKSPILKSFLFGVAGSFLIFSPVFIINRFGYTSPVLPKPHGAELLSAILAISLLGNFLEEILFRGYLQDILLRNGVGLRRTILISGLTFSLCHVFLAFTVTNTGTPILIFTAWEGLICAFLASRFGLASAVLAHGLGIFWISTAIFI